MPYTKAREVLSDVGHRQCASRQLMAWHAQSADKWSARISWQDAQFCLGAYDTEEEVPP